MSVGPPGAVQSCGPTLRIGPRQLFRRDVQRSALRLSHVCQPVGTDKVCDLDNYTAHDIAFLYETREVLLLEYTIT